MKDERSEGRRMQKRRSRRRRRRTRRSGWGKDDVERRMKGWGNVFEENERAM